MKIQSIILILFLLVMSGCHILDGQNRQIDNDNFADYVPWWSSNITNSSTRDTNTDCTVECDQ